MRPPSTSPPLLARARHGRAPRAARRGSSAIERELERRGWLGYERATAPRGRRARPARRVHPARLRRRDRASCARRGGGAIDADTVVEPGLLRGGAARGGRRGRARRRAARRRGAEPAFGACGRPATTPRPRARWASACSTTSPSRRATRSTRTALERVLVLDWDVHHGNGTNDIFYDDRRGPVRLASTSRRCIPGTGAASRDRGERRGRGLHRQPPGARRARATPSSCSLVEHVVVPLARAYRAGAGARLRRLRRPPRRPARRLRADRGRLRGDDARRCAALADELGAPLGVVLEGGYDLGALARSVAATMEELAQWAGPRRAGRARARCPPARARGARPASRGTGRSSRRPRAGSASVPGLRRRGGRGGRGRSRRTWWMWSGSWPGSRGGGRGCGPGGRGGRSGLWPRGSGSVGGRGGGRGRRRSGGGGRPGDRHRRGELAGGDDPLTLSAERDEQDRHPGAGESEQNRDHHDGDPPVPRRKDLRRRATTAVQAPVLLVGELAPALRAVDNALRRRLGRGHRC